MTVKVLGGNCSNCKTLEKMTENALKELGVNVSIEKITDIQTILAYGVMTTPALIINEKIIISGRIPSAQELREQIGKQL